MHDDDLDRTTNMNGPLNKFNFVELEKCNCAAKFSFCGKNYVDTFMYGKFKCSFQISLNFLCFTFDLSVHKCVCITCCKNCFWITQKSLSKLVIISFLIFFSSLGSQDVTSNFEPICTLENLIEWSIKNNVKMLFDVKDTEIKLVKLIALLFERYNLYNKAIVCSFFPTVVYRIKKENPNILTGITWRRWFITYEDIEFTVPRSSSKLIFFISMILDVIWIWCVKLWIPEFLGVDMVLTERREISPFYLKNMTARGFKVCAWTVNERNEMAWMSRELKIPFLTDAPYIASHVLKNVNAEKN
ncbi:unnamed protein product [Meloidogyne enterolobii]|uniref:Uncharacterized protein n=1 Tax=Meloidogyne enterolobii TaxID=390850 RepID=A0ACB0ZF70_MELEN